MREIICKSNFSCAIPAPAAVIIHIYLLLSWILMPARQLQGVPLSSLLPEEQRQTLCCSFPSVTGALRTETLN